MEQDNLHFFEHDMRLPYAANLFGYCFNFFTSFGYFRTQRENENAIRTMAQALKPGGKLMIDYLNIPFVEAHFVESNETQIDGVHFSIRRRQDERFFYKTMDISVKAHSGTETYTEQVRKYSLNDFYAMLQNHGMQNIQVFGSYDLEPYAAAQSPRMIIIAERKHTA
jgi:SAM-dependent methyltransferase